MVGLREATEDEAGKDPSGRVSAIQRSGPLRSALVWLLSTAGGVVIGAVGTSYFDRSNPVASIAEINITTQFNERFGKKQTVKVPSTDLFVHLEDSDWLDAPPRTRAISLTDLVNSLEQDSETTITLLQQLELFKNSANRLNSLLSAPSNLSNAENFFDEWRLADKFLYPLIFFGLDTGELERKRRNHKNKPYLMINPTEDKGIITYYVSKRGSAVSSIASSPRSERNDDAKTIAEALAFFDQDILSEYVNLANKQLQSSFYLHEQIRKELPETLKSYSRWSIATLISNSGGHAVSFSPKATLYIDTHGTPAGPGYTKIDLESRLVDEQPEPVEVKGGESRLVQYVSKKIVRADDKWENLLRLFSENIQNCFLVLHPQLDFWHKNPNMTSDLTKFGPVKAEQLLAEKEIESYFRQ